MKILNIIALPIVLLTVALTFSSCSGVGSLYINKMYNDVFWLDESTSFKIDMSLPVFKDKYTALNYAVEEQKRIYIELYKEGCSLAISLYDPEYGLPDDIGYHISYEVTEDDRSIVVVLKNEYLLPCAAYRQTEFTTLRYDKAENRVMREEGRADGYKVTV